MAKRENHYEAAFEAWLRVRKIPYLAVDETKRSLAEGRSLKNLDFVVSPPSLPHSWLVDVKGRRFPTGKSYWKNWVTAEELQSLASWEALFGDRFSGLLVFAYNVVGELAPLPADELFPFRGGLYGFVGIRLEHYASWAQPLSPRWGTVSIPTNRFRSLAQGVNDILQNSSSGKREVARTAS
jgi:hypothetical protein